MIDHYAHSTIEGKLTASQKAVSVDANQVDRFMITTISHHDQARCADIAIDGNQPAKKAPQALS
jgi:hypothetical protein